METNTVIAIEDVLTKKKEDFDNETLLKFEKASREFDILVKKGLAKKRGYNLLSITDKNISQTLYSSNLR
ncbi:MAG: hypothetical protein GXO89_10745 [Chlorobi bacterium]|nr:hypothetical protein [Chlorobiota bacterium]